MEIIAILFALLMIAAVIVAATFLVGVFAGSAWGGFIFSALIFALYRGYQSGIAPASASADTLNAFQYPLADE